MARRRYSQRGFTLIELMIAVGILGILMSLGVRSYRTWIANSKVRNATDSIQAGLLLAKAEAMRRNGKVQFVFTNTDPVQANVNGVTASTTGSNWMVRVYQSGGTYSSSDFVEGRSSSEGSSGVSVSAGQSTFVYNSVGWLDPVPGATVNINITNTGSADRPLRVTVSRGGAVRICDPALDLTTSPLGC